ncbi:hypothetical protein JZ751_026361 [Albula glossodonta]|uniref:C2H2-type domain-containing protein n=1 Tax=Albula glossodonta TaxID=121402 RepID=A0A8T2PKF2_9TELE|nr:hypothetical protein JZ751_026361 [Albula glossodonta]
MVAVQEILEMVENTVSEYQEETARTKRENETILASRGKCPTEEQCCEKEWSSSLRQQDPELTLTEEKQELIPSFSTAGVQSTAQPASRGKCLTEQQCCEKEWSSSLRQQDPELTLTEEKHEFSEEHTSTQREEEPVLSSSCVKSDYNLEFISPNTYSMKTTETEEKGDFIEQQWTRLREEKNNGPESVHMEETETNFVSPGLKKMALEITLSMVSPSSVNPEIANSICNDNGDTSMMEPLNSNPCSLPSVRPDQIKAEPEEVDLTSEQLYSYIPKTQYGITETLCETSVVTASDRSATETGHMPPSGTAYANEIQCDSLLIGHRKERQHSCLQCGKCFSHVSYVKVHQHIHTGERPYSCAWCGKSFTQSGDLRRHERIHTGVKPHHCTWCDKSFTQVGNLKRHLRIHTGERPYCCTRCGKTFYDGGALKNHKRIHMRERKQKICEKER